MRKLEQTNDPEIIDQVWKELWNELHHQGDVGLASYFGLPQLVRIGKSKKLFDWYLLGLSSVIEQQRHLQSRPWKLSFYELFNFYLITVMVPAKGFVHLQDL